jgi:two-component system chemotaxis sensor kinase CheA
MNDNISVLKELLPLTQSLKILYVEDNEEARIQTLKMLTNFCKNIDVAVNGQDGLDKYKNEETSYDLIITDINMPIMDGLKMSKSILDINKKQHILVISAYNDSKNLQMCIETGITNYLHKPIKLESIIEVLSKTVKSIIESKNSKKHLTKIETSNNELDALVSSFDKYVIASRTDLKGVITYVSRAYESISGYKKEELLGKPHSIARHQDMPKETFADMWKTIKEEKTWHGEIKNLKKDGSFYWVDATISPYYDAENNHIGYSAVRVNITSKKKVEVLNKQINDLLNNAKEGFLSFDKDLKCESSFSKECLDIFQMDTIENENISELLFKNNLDQKELFIKAIKNILNSNDDTTKELFLSLAPSEVTLYKKTIHIEYKMLQNSRFMIILTDITDKKELEEQLSFQNQIQKMIVEVATNRDDFLDLKSNFESFLCNPPQERLELLRALHTFKGVFAQKEMLYIPDAIHEVESNIKDKKDISTCSFDKLFKTFTKDLDIIKSNLQDPFLKDDKLLKIEETSLINIEKKIHTITIDNDRLKDDMDEILFDLNKFRYKPIKEMLNIYPKHVNTIAKKLDKHIYPLEVEGDSSIVIPPKLAPFIKSLVHVFNNSIDHGIEKIDTRVELGKDEIGTIKCSFDQINNILVVEISDDGMGIDTNKLISSVVKKGFKTKQECDLMSDDEKLRLIFLDNLSTHEKSSLISGRGVGMAAVKEAIDQLGGKILITNNIGKGVKFEFLIPIDNFSLHKSYYKDEETISFALSKQIHVLLEQNCSLEVLKEETIDKIDTEIFTQYNSKINLTNGYDGSVIIYYSKELNKNFGDAFIPGELSDEDIQEIEGELPSEVINIIVGLAISDFPKHLGAVNISVPKKVEDTDIEKIKKNNNLIKKITTKTGELLYMIIKDENQTIKSKEDKIIKDLALV